MRFSFGKVTPEQPAQAATSRGEARKPKVGLALGAGAARGWAQIGVLREFLANGLAPEIIAGTSMGAVVGGCFAAGRLDQLEAFALSLTKRRVFGLMDFTMSGTGLLSGSRLRAALERDLGTWAIEDLPMRFASVATQVHTGHEIWLTKGSLVEAMRASYALPGVFEPVRIEGRWLIDGALVNPVPVSVCRALGADIVIAVNLVTETLTVRDEDATPGPRARPASAREDAGPSMAKVLVDAFNITQDRIARSRLAGDPPDLTINVKVGRIGLFEFHRATEAMAIGRDAALRAMPDLAEILPYPARVPTKVDEPPSL